MGSSDVGEAQKPDRKG